MPSSITDDRHISVFETTLSIQQNTLSVFNVIIQSPQSTVSLIRYPFDFVEFHQKIRFYYPKSKISFPTLNNPSNQSRCVRRRSIRDILTFSRKSNAEKIEKYLQHCFRHPIISISSILRDFLKVQRDEDALLMSQRDDPIPVLNNNVSNRREVEIPTSLPSTPTPTPLPPVPVQVEQVLQPFSLNQVQLLKVLGKGCMGKVLLIKSNQNKSLYALKVMKKKWIVQQNEVIHTRAERDILVKLQESPFIAKLNYVFQTNSDLYLVLNYYPGGDIATQLSIHSYFSEQQTLFYTAEILEGLSALHKNNIVYRDLKPENVLIDRTGHIILTDFGLSKIFSEKDVGEDGAPVTRTFCGTAEYLAPEVLLGELYTFVVDFWSLGTLLYEMLAGVTPFWADNHMDMYQRVLDDSLEFPTSFDSITCHFLSGLLQKDPNKRLGWGEYGINEIKSHPYFSRINWKDVSTHRIVPPYIPSLSSETDLSHFDTSFTSMSPRISQSSTLSVNDDCDPFEGFSYDPVMEKQEAKSQGTSPSSLNNGESSTPQRTGLRKRQSAALSFSTNTDNTKNNEDRATKKRQTNMVYQQLAIKPSIPQKTSDIEMASSISSQASLSFSSSTPHVPVTRTGSEVSDDSSTSRHLSLPSSIPPLLPPLPSQPLPPIALHSPYETSNYVDHDRSLNTQTHHHNRYSTVSTLANSICSDLTVSNNDDVVSITQHSYYTMPPPLNQFYS